MSPLRIGVISFVNTLPLIRGLEAGMDGDYELVHANPSVLADRLRYGELDVALIPAVEFLRGVGDGFVPGLCIASRGPVESIRLLAKKPLGEIDRVLVDRGSRSSVAMLRLLLDRVHRVSPDFHIYRPDPARPFLGPEGGEADAALLIGDLAMEADPSGALHDVDLGEWWQGTFHRPFVYALWVYKNRVPGDDLGETLEPLLRESFRLGLEQLDAICAEAAAAKGWEPSRVREYLTRRIHYDLDGEALAGLAQFRRLCVENYLCPARASVAEALDAASPEAKGLSRAGL